MPWNRKEYRSRPEVIAAEKAWRKQDWKNKKSDPIRLAKQYDYHRKYLRDYRAAGRDKSLGKPKRRVVENRIRERQQIDLLKIALSNPEFVATLKELCPRGITGRNSLTCKTEEERIAKAKAARKRNKIKTMARIRANPEALEEFRNKAKFRTKRWRKSEHGIQRRKEYYHNPSFRLAFTMRNRIRQSMRRAGGERGAKYDYDIGCTPNEFCDYIQFAFEPQMTWDNYGKGEGKWNLDHVRPLSSFNLMDSAQYKEAFHYRNIVPKWHVENIRKQAQWNGRRWRHSDHKQVSA